MVIMRYLFKKKERNTIQINRMGLNKISIVCYDPFLFVSSVYQNLKNCVLVMIH